ncbi:hypothetical protein ABZ403_21855 [Micromonospora zamorensis]|uniref:hypothetical protein n=1 Tax=Micromonospora zamorensis TaxID=709883 RepID=UPI0033D22DDF
MASAETVKWPLPHLLPAQASLNAELGKVRRLEGVAADWLGAARLRSDRRSRVLTEEVTTARREKQAKRLIMADHIDFVRDLAKVPGAAAIWWSYLHPDKLGFLTDGSFRQLLDLQPNPSDYSIAEASDESAKTVREFLSAVSDVKARTAIAKYLEIVNKWVDSDRVG